MLCFIIFLLNPSFSLWYPLKIGTFLIPRTPPLILNFFQNETCDFFIFWWPPPPSFITLQSLNCMYYIAFITLHSLHCIHHIVFITLHSLHCIHHIAFIMLHSLHYIALQSFNWFNWLKTLIFWPLPSKQNWYFF